MTPKRKEVFEVRVGFGGMRVSQRAPILFLPPHINCVCLSINAVSEYFLSQRVYLPSCSVCIYCVSDVFIHTVWSEGFLWTYPEGIWNLLAVLKKTILQSAICYNFFPTSVSVVSVLIIMDHVTQSTGINLLKIKAFLPPWSFPCKQHYLLDSCLH